MIQRIIRPFQIKTRFEAFAIIYALALGAVERGEHYMMQFPGRIGWVFFALCTIAVFMGGGKILDALK